MMKQQPLKLGWLLSMLVWMFIANAQTPTTTNTKHSFSIQQVVEYATKNNVQVKNALLNLKNQQQQNREITAAALPTISGNLNTTFSPNIAVQSIPNFISPATYAVLVNEGVRNGSGQPITMPNNFGFIEAAFGRKWNGTAAVSLQQLLFDGQVFIGLQARKTSIDFQQKNIEVTEEAIKLNIHKIYYQLVVAKTQIDLIEANINRLKKLQSDTKALYQNGFVEKLDVDKIAVQLSNLQTQKANIEGNVEIGYLGLKTLMGMPVKDTLILVDVIKEDEIKSGVLVDAYQYNDRKDFQYASLGKKLNEFNVKRYQLSQLPTIALSGSYAKNAQRDKFNFFGRGDWFTISQVGLNMSIPIFNGFAKTAKIQQAKIALEQTNNQISALKNNIDSEVISATIHLKTALNAMDSQKQNMSLAESVYNQTKKKYEAGTGSNTEITLAQTDLIGAQTNYINALYEAIIAKIDYLKAIGKL
ncbi:MAG: TolC family protein [Chitinophagaceae bacterium]